MKKPFQITNINYWLADQKLKYPHGTEGINFKRLKHLINQQYERQKISKIEKNNMILTLQMCDICYDKHKIDKKYSSIIADIERIQTKL